MSLEPHVMYDKCVALLQERGVALEDIADCAMYLQHKYHPDLKPANVLDIVKTVLHKREVQHAILTGIELDKLTEQEAIGDPDLQRILRTDYSLYGVDEVLAYGICNLYGSIALTNFGYIDKEKPGIIGHLNSKGPQCNTFLDDIVGAVAAATASKIAHTIEEE